MSQFKATNRSDINIDDVISRLIVLEKIFSPGIVIGLAGGFSSFSAFPYDAVPDGWLKCDGKVYDKEQYPELYKVIGHRYNTALTNNLFAVPNLGAIDSVTGTIYIIKT